MKLTGKWCDIYLLDAVEGRDLQWFLLRELAVGK